jgi:hypothetical protein
MGTAATVVGFIFKNNYLPLLKYRSSSCFHLTFGYAETKLGEATRCLSLTEVNVELTEVLSC